MVAPGARKAWMPNGLGCVGTSASAALLNERFTPRSCAHRLSGVGRKHRSISVMSGHWPDPDRHEWGLLPLHLA